MMTMGFNDNETNVTLKYKKKDEDDSYYILY